MISGLTAGIAESIAVVTPGECLKTRMIQNAAKGGKKVGMITAIGDAIKYEGVFALWKGLGPVLCKQGTNSAVRFACFASLKEQVAKRWPGKEKMATITLGIGGASGIATVYVGLSLSLEFRSSILVPELPRRSQLNIELINFGRLICQNAQIVNDLCLELRTPCKTWLCCCRSRKDMDR